MKEPCGCGVGLSKELHQVILALILYEIASLDIQAKGIMLL
jgi:hypothetical protein